MTGMCDTNVTPQSATPHLIGGLARYGRGMRVQVCYTALSPRAEDELRALACLQKLAAVRRRLAALSN